MRPLGKPGLLATIALRNLFRHTGKSLIVGSILVFGTLLLVTGTALLDSVERSMQESVTGSLSGHLQIYSKKAKDKLDLFGGASAVRPDIGHLPDFAAVKAAIADVPGVRAVVPMGLNDAMATSGTELDRWLADLRAAVRDGDAGKAAAAKGHVRQIVALIAEEHARAAALVEDQGEFHEAEAALARAGSDAFWAGFDAAPLDDLEFLENEIAPLSNTTTLMFVRYLGTDLDLFARTFDKFEIVKGQPVPAGKRGFLFNQKFHEDFVKNLVARELDQVKKLKEAGRTIADDAALREKVARLSRQYQRITFQLDADGAAKLEAALAPMVPDAKGGLDEKLQAFLLVNDDNFADRYAAFYREVAPRIRLYDIDVGDVLTVTSFTRAGYVKSVNVKVYGTFRFKGIEGSDLAGSHNLVDLATFRDLLGLMTAEKRAELQAIRAKVGVAAVARENAEDALFGGDDAATVTVAGAAGGLEGVEDRVLGDVDRRAGWDLPVSADDLGSGVVLNAAVVLDDPARLPAVKPAIEARLAERGIDAQVVDWQAAAGMVGQFIFIVRLVLLVALLIVFGVALVILNNTMVMATMERTNEIGTMRAIGAGRRFVVSMLLAETLALGLVAGGIGSLLGAGLVKLLGAVGVTAPSDVLIFLFGGPRLYPTVGVGHLVGALAVILLVALGSTLYPAWLAIRVQPIEAMRREE
jgi:ABC-type lipoprotein release transport system permease subunit